VRHVFLLSYLCAIQTYGAQSHELHLGGHLQHLHKQAGEFVNEAPAKGGQGVVVGWLPAAM